MIDNNLLFSLVLAVINTLSFYFLKNNEEDLDIDKRNQELLMLFGITFSTSFLLKLFLSGDILKSGGSKEKILTHSSRAPF
tara:strand:- start:2736 stop:2978 length:243 start_codon:yes stop_codon:yes gene_type:complete